MPHFLNTIGKSNSDSSNETNEVLTLIEKVKDNLFIYLYPCLIEYSLICVTVFYIIWRNIGRKSTRLNNNFSHRHIYRVNCSRSSRGLLIGGIIFLLTIITLIPGYVLQPASAVPITHITQLSLLIVAFIVVCVSFYFTTEMDHDPEAHVNSFDQILILLTTIGDFAYSFFGLFASVFISTYNIEIPRPVEIVMGIVAVIQTFIQSAFIFDAFKRRSIRRNRNQKRPGREWITILLLINLSKKNIFSMKFETRS